MSARIREVVAAVLAGVLLLALSGCSVVLPSLGSTMKVTAYLSDSAGLFVGNDVGVLGVTVGKITKITPQGDEVRVDMEVSTDHPVPTGAAAVVVSRSVATDRYIELTPVYRSGPRMQSGAVIPLDRTRTPVEFDQVLGSLDKLATGIAGKGATKDAIGRLLASQSKALKGKGRLVNRAVHSLAAASDGVSAQRRNATSTIVALDGLTTTLAQNQTTVQKFVRQVAKASSLLAAERHDFKTSLEQVTTMVDVVARFARENRRELTRTVSQTDSVLGTVMSQRRQVAEILRVTPLASQNLRRMLGKDGRLRVRLDPTQLTPLGGIVDEVCATLPGDPCASIGLDPTQLIGLLGTLLGGGTP